MSLYAMSYLPWKVKLNAHGKKVDKTLFGLHFRTKNWRGPPTSCQAAFCKSFTLHTYPVWWLKKIIYLTGTPSITPVAIVPVSRLYYSFEVPGIVPNTLQSRPSCTRRYVALPSAELKPPVRPLGRPRPSQLLKIYCSCLPLSWSPRCGH